MTPLLVVGIVTIGVLIAFMLQRSLAARGRAFQEPPATHEAGTDARLGLQLYQLSRLNAAMAHDIRGPLGAVTLNLELLKDSVERDPGSAARERRLGLLRVVREDLKRLHEMIEALLSQTRLSAGASDSFDLRDVLSDAQALIRPQCGRVHVQMEVALPPEKVSMQGNGDELRQALLAHMIDALDALPDGGELRVRLTAEQDLATIAVAISGNGTLHRSSAMPAPARDASRTARSLRSAQQVIQEQGGRIHTPAESAIGPRFEIELRRAPGPN
jgi:signal transduction histidine kinase